MVSPHHKPAQLQAEIRKALTSLLHHGHNMHSLSEVVMGRENRLLVVPFCLTACKAKVKRNVTPRGFGAGPLQRWVLRECLAPKVLRSVSCSNLRFTECAANRECCSKRLRILANTRALLPCVARPRAEHPARRAFNVEAEVSLTPSIQTSSGFASGCSSSGVSFGATGMASPPEERGASFEAVGAIPT